MLCDLLPVVVARFVNTHPDLQTSLVRHMETPSIVTVVMRTLHLPSHAGDGLSRLQVGRVRDDATVVHLLLALVRGEVAGIGSNPDARGEIASNAAEILCTLMRT